MATVEDQHFEAAVAANSYAKRIENLEALIAAQNAQLESYRRLYDMFGADDATDAKFVEAYELVRIGDRL